MIALELLHWIVVVILGVLLLVWLAAISVALLILPRTPLDP